MTITLNHWQAGNGYARIYVNGLATSAKVFVENGRRGLKITSGDMSPDDVERAIKEAFNLAEMTWPADSDSDRPSFR